MNWHLFSTRLLFATGLLAAQVVGGQTAYVWSGGSGDWTTAANWTPNGVPAAADTAIINNGGTVTVSADTSVNTLNLTNSTLTGTATLTVTNAFNWAGGTVNGSGTLTLLATVNGTISGSNTKFLDGGRVLNNAGTLVWTGTGQINLRQGTWNNSGLLDCQSDTAMSDDSTSGVGSFFNNTGTVRKSAGTSTTSFSSLESFANSGTVDVQSGSVTMNGTPFHNNGTARTQAGVLTLGTGGGTGGGTFEAVSPGLVSFTGGTHTLTNGARLIGTGTNQVAGATVTFPDDVGAERLEVTGGTVNGTGTVTVTNGFYWSGGTLGGSGTLTLLATVNGTISSSNTKFLDGGRVLNNQGTLVWTGGQVNLRQGTWNNSGLLDCQNDATMSDGSTSGVGSFFNNTGTVRKSAGAGITTFSSLQSFANNATVEVLTGIVSMPSTYSMTGSSVHRFGLGGTAPGTGYGRLQINGATTLSGALEAMLVNGFSAAAGDTFLVVTFTSRTGTFASFSGPSGNYSDQYYGTTVAIRVLGAATYTWKGAGANWVDPTQWTPDGVPGAGDTVNIGSGSAMIGAATTVATLNLSGGAVSGAGPLNITGTFNWTGGNREGPGLTTIPPGAVLNLSGAASKGFYYHTLENSGTINWDGSGTWSGHSSPVLSNLVGGVINILSDAAMTRFNNAVIIHNAGLIRKTGGTGTKTMTVTLSNTGTLEVNSGKLLIDYGFTNRNQVNVAADCELVINGNAGASSGQFQVGANGYVSYTGGNQALETNAVVSGDGFLYVGGATLAMKGMVTVQNLQLVAGAISGAGPLTIGGVFNWSGGNREGPGLTVIQPAAVVNLTGSGSKGFFFHTLENAGMINWDGTGPWSGHTGPVLSNLASGVINLMSDAELTRFNNSAVIHNAGAIRKTGGTGTKTMDVVFSSTGTLEVNSGRLDIISGFTNRNQVTVAPDCQLVISGASGASSGQFQVGANALLSYTSGNQALETNAVVSGDGFLNVGGSANLAVKGTVSVQNLQLVAGAISGAGPLTIGGVFNWSGGNREGPGLTVIQPAAVVNLTGAGSKGFFFHTLENAGTINWDGAGPWSGHSGPVLSNLASGVINMMSDAALTRFNSSAIIHNAGLIRKTGGTGTQTLDVVVTNSGTLDIRTGVLSIVNSYTPTTTSTHRFAVGGYDAGTGYGRLTASGTVALAGQLDLMLTNSFTPTNNATFAVLTATTRTGTFSSVTGRGIGGGLYFNPVYSSTAVTLTVADGTPSITANSAAWVGGKFQFRLNGIASETYRIDASTNFANWSAISTNVLSGSAFLDFVDIDSPLFPHRFYRGVFLP